MSYSSIYILSSRRVSRESELGGQNTLMISRNLDKWEHSGPKDEGTMTRGNRQKRIRSG